ncbi:MAG: OmpH family outer membrane protein [Candidatus Omnitrophica bacterium]|nr:OmpH family outer membrane protein [Candidatus Omnitrophota bacterium]
MKAVKFLSVVILGLFLTTTVHAKDLKIASVDLARVFDNYQKTKEYDAVLQKEAGAYQKQHDDMVNKIRDAQGKLALLKEDEKQKLQVDIEKQKTDLLGFDRQKRIELAQKHDNKVKEILLEIEKIVTDIAQKENYTFILDNRFLIYGDKDLNMSERVLKALNDSYPGKK